MGRIYACYNIGTSLTREYNTRVQIRVYNQELRNQGDYTAGCLAQHPTIKRENEELTFE